MELLTANSEDEAKTSKPKTPSNDLSKSSSSIYGSLPRVASSNSRHLPTLPETGPLVRSMSLKDNSNVDSDAPNSSASSSTNKPSSPPQSTQSHLSKSPQQQQSVLRRVNSAGGAPQTPLITDLMKPPAPTTTSTTTTTTNNNEAGGVFKVPPTPPKTLDLWYVQNSHTNQPTSA